MQGVCPAGNLVAHYDAAMPELKSCAGEKNINPKPQTHRHLSKHPCSVFRMPWHAQNSAMFSLK